MEERRQKQERDRNNLLMFQQQQSGGGGGGLGFGGDGGGGRRRPHVSETSYERGQRSQTDSVQATLQQQIAEKKQREAERKRMEAEEDAALNARLEEQQRKVREEAEREQEARKAKERGRLERQRLIEEQQKRSHDEAQAMKKAARDRRQGAQGSTTVNDWGSWAADDRPAGKAAAPPEEDLWQNPAPEPWQAPAVEEPPPRAPSPPPVERPDQPPGPSRADKHVSSPVSASGHQIPSSSAPGPTAPAPPPKSPPIPTLCRSSPAHKNPGARAEHTSKSPRVSVPKRAGPPSELPRSGPSDVPSKSPPIPTLCNSSPSKPTAHGPPPKSPPIPTLVHRASVPEQPRSERVNPHPFVDRLSPPLPAQARGAFDPREVTAGPYDVPPPSRPVPRQRSLLTARPNRSPTPHRPGSRPLEHESRPPNSDAHCELTPRSDHLRSLTPASARHRSLTPITSRVRSLTPETAGQGHRALTPAGDWHEPPVIANGYNGSHESIQTHDLLTSRRPRVLPPIAESMNRAREESQSRQVEERLSRPKTRCIADRREVIPTGSPEPCADASQSPVRKARLSSGHLDHQDQGKYPDKKNDKKNADEIRSKEVHSMPHHRSEEQESTGCSEGQPNANARRSRKLQVDTKSATKSHISIVTSKRGKWDPDSDFSVVHKMTEESPEKTLSPRKEERKTLEVPAVQAARASPVSPHFGRHALPPIKPSSQRALFHPAPHEPFTLHHAPKTTTQTPHHIEKVSTPVRGNRSERSHIPVSTRRLSGSISTHPLSPRGASAAPGSAHVAEVTEVTPPRVTARRRWQRPETDHSPEETVVVEQSRQPPPITPRKSLSISLRSETETVLVGLREEGIPCVPSADELEDIDKADEREREDKVGSRPSSTKDEEANEENVDMRRKIEQERLPSAEQLHQEQTSPFSSTSSSSTVTPSSSPVHSPDPVPCSLTPEPVTPPRPQPIERQSLVSSGHQRSPVPTPRLSRGDLRLSRSNRPALRRLQMMRRTLEREHDALSSALAREETAITGRPTPETSSISQSPSPSPTEEQNDQLLDHLETQITLNQSWMALDPDAEPKEIHPSQDTSDLKIGFRWDRPQTERPEMRLDSPQLDDLAKRNRDRQRRLEERKKAGQ